VKGPEDAKDQQGQEDRSDETIGLKYSELILYNLEREDLEREEANLETTQD
jgi:hypothetical protein